MPLMDSEARSILQTAKETLPGYVESELSREERYAYLLDRFPAYYLATRDLEIPRRTMEGSARESGFLENMKTRFPNTEDFDDTFLDYNIQHGTSEALETVHHYQAMLEPVEGNQPTPDITLCMPIAILGETDETLHAVMKQIVRSAQASGRRTRVIAWTNAHLAGIKSHRDQTLSSAQARYLELRDLFSEYSSDMVQVTTALDTPADGDFSMSQIRSHFMDALVGEVIDGAIPSDHPVMWLDADTTRMSPETLGRVVDTTHMYPFEFCHPDVDYSLEWADGKPASEMDNASKVFLIDEMARRARKRAMISVDELFPERSYPEESGMSFTMLAYMAAGGIDEDDPINESVRLTRRLHNFYMMTTASFSRLPSLAMPFMSPRTEYKRLSSTQRQNVHWLNDVSVQLSGRRIYEGIKSHGARSLTNRESQVGDTYVLFSDLNKGTPSADIIIDDPTALRSVFLREQQRKTGKKLAKKVVDRMLKNKVLWP